MTGLVAAVLASQRQDGPTQANLAGGAEIRPITLLVVLAVAAALSKNAGKRLKP